MAGMVIFFAISGGAVAFMVFFFLNICNESRRAKVCRIARLSTGKGFQIENSEVMESTSGAYFHSESPWTTELGRTGSGAVSGNSLNFQKVRIQSKVS